MTQQSPLEILEIKAVVRFRDGNRCLRCGMTSEEHRAKTGRNLDVHRVVPGSEYSIAPGVCQTLCRKCHGPRPRRKRGSVPRLCIDMDRIFWARIKCHAIMLGVHPKQWINDRLRIALAPEIAELEAWDAQQTPPADPES